MNVRQRSRYSGAPARRWTDGLSDLNLSLVLLLLLLAVLWIAGGSARGDVSGQIFVRGAGWLSLCTMALFGVAPDRHRAWPVGVLLGCALVLVLVQLVPLPPAWWQSLPGRAFIAGFPDNTHPWRPLSLSPGATVNAASALIIPIATFFLAIGISKSAARRMPGVILILVAASALVGLLQFSGGGFDNVLTKDAPGDVSGMFANRNHFALFTAIGCLVAPHWAVQRRDGVRWRAPVALAMILLFVLIIMASGSRAGLLLGGLGLGVGLALARHRIRRELASAPRWAFPALIGVLVAAVGLFIMLSVAANRAVSIDRLIALDPKQDLRRQGLSTVIDMIRVYFPVGSGFGGFDPVFRMHEPFALLKPTYFNHAHNEFLEIVLDAGLPGMILLGGAILWWVWASIGAWRASSGEHDGLARLGSGILLLIGIASVVDYPARTPMMMAIAVIAAVWLSDRAGRNDAPALPSDTGPL